MRSSSAAGNITIRDRLLGALALAQSYRGRLKRGFGGEEFNRSFRDYDACLARNSRGPLTGKRVLEIGYGARPYRLVWLYSNGVDVFGVDLDAPLIGFDLGRIGKIWRTNGAVRALKSALRRVLFDAREWAQLAQDCERMTGKPLSIPADRLMVADASSSEFWQAAGSFDLIYSEDVFEHIPPDRLRQLVGHMARAMRPGALAFIRPMIFTGICGGHQLEWYPYTLRESRERKTDPWEHLRRKRAPADTYLNEMTRADYRALFEEHFRIVEEVAEDPNMGRQFMTPGIREELSDYGDDELFSNLVRFVLERRPG